MNIIFLDIDGVLVTSRHLHKTGDDRTAFDPVSVGYLNQLISKSNAKIVISSNWRRFRSIESLRDVFSKNGVIGEIIGATPWYDDFTIMRGQEIQTYLHEHHVKQFVILDDEENMLHLSANYVQTDPRVGITEVDYERAYSILNQEKKELIKYQFFLFLRLFLVYVPFHCYFWVDIFSLAFGTNTLDNIVAPVRKVLIFDIS